MGSNFQPLTWKIRMKIALDAAKGLAFLHSDEVEKKHGDFKTSKILIDYNYNAKLSFFGLVQCRSDSNMPDFDMVDMGTQINAEPEYIDTDHLTKESDVYNFGVVLLEIMSGKRAFDRNRPLREHDLVEWAKPLLTRKHKISQVMDVRIEGQYSSREAKKLAHIVIQCLSERPEHRPKTEEIVRSLEQLQDSNDTIGGVVSS
nr:nodulation protein [Melilotus officinalis]